MRHLDALFSVIYYWHTTLSALISQLNSPARNADLVAGVPGLCVHSFQATAATMSRIVWQAAGHTAREPRVQGTVLTNGLQIRVGESHG
jgi:hypothetical protein